jgi:glucose/arabinose dehydrogenase
MLLAAILLIAAGCSPKEPPGPKWKIETVADHLHVPWELAFAPDGRIFFTERNGRVRVIGKDGKLLDDPAITVTDVENVGETGMTGLVLHPNFTKNHWVYIAYAYSPHATVRIVRYTEAANKLTNPEILLDDIPGYQIHAGTALSFGPDGKLYATTGDTAKRELAQDLTALQGKTLRLNDDGTVPSDNPFVGRKDARPEIWTYGNRNSQGIAWQPGTGQMWEAEHGPSGFDGPGGGDEINLIKKGANYGWPVVHHDMTHAGMESPKITWTPAVAPSGCAFYTGDKLPQFKGNLFVGCLAGKCLMRLTVDGDRITDQDKLITDLGRIRAVANGPDGCLYFTTSNRDGRGLPGPDDDRILKLVPDSAANHG